jgi:SAM-dependent MidA family methyltransferase
MSHSGDRRSPIADLIRERGPVTVAAFMDLALYHPQLGYYARAGQRSGRAGDFFTSVDVGALFGELLEIQIAEMAGLLGRAPFDLVEAGAGNGRLAADVLRAARRHHPQLYNSLRLHLVEASAAARSAQASSLGEVAERLVSSSDRLPEALDGVLFANELLDALPVHQVVMREDGLREVYVAMSSRGLQTIEGPLSTPALAEYLRQNDVRLESGWLAEINLRAVGWLREATASLTRGFMILIDYGHEARDLYSLTHATGTLTAFRRHTTAAETAPERPEWLHRPGEQDITAHVDFTTARRIVESAGWSVLGFLDQTYFLLGLASDEVLSRLTFKQRLALKTLVAPGGLGSTLKVLIAGKQVGAPALKGCSYRVRVT